MDISREDAEAMLRKMKHAEIVLLLTVAQTLHDMIEAEYPEKADHLLAIRRAMEPFVEGAWMGQSN